MDDLISRKAFREAMHHEAFEMDSDMQKWDSGCWIRYKMFENHLKEAPSVPAVPLEPLAKWIVENLDPRCDCNYCFNESTDFEDRECCNCPKMSEEQVKEALTKWMEEQDAAD